MKTVSGKIISSTPVSVSKATTILSKFVTSDTGASQAVCAYLRRAVVAFNELNRLHAKSYRRRNKTNKSNAVSATTAVELPTHSVENGVKDVKESQDEGNTGIGVGREKINKVSVSGDKIHEGTVRKKHNKKQRKENDDVNDLDKKVESGKVDGDNKNHGTAVRMDEKEERMKMKEFEESRDGSADHPRKKKQKRNKGGEGDD